MNDKKLKTKAAGGKEALCREPADSGREKG
jgi:hypothetical protein